MAISLIIPLAAEGVLLLPVGPFEFGPEDSSVVFTVPDNPAAIDAATLTTGSGSREGVDSGRPS